LAPVPTGGICLEHLWKEGIELLITTETVIYGCALLAVSYNDFDKLKIFAHMKHSLNLINNSSKPLHSALFNCKIQDISAQALLLAIFNNCSKNICFIIDCNSCNVCVFVKNNLQ
jgi:hypothetical protein